MGGFPKEPTDIMSAYHRPVLLREVLAAFAPFTEKLIIDATIGGGGHSAEFLRAGARIFGIDADSDAISESSKTLAAISPEGWQVVRGNFGDIAEITSKYGIKDADGILVDLGVSSFQIDSPQKGFSYRKPESKLDMRFNPSGGLTAAEIINTWTGEDLYDLFATLGEEKRARTIAMALVRARSVKKFSTAGDLTEIIRKAAGERDFIPTAARVYQALRIRVNDELGSLRRAMDEFGSVLKKGGILAVISFHSLEDRIVKLEMKKPTWEPITKKPLRAGLDEISENVRARSAKLRIVKKI
jgi:16S rRNA (cytosine1402-N4)-methyltransferase